MAASPRVGGSWRSVRPGHVVGAGRGRSVLAISLGGEVRHYRDSNGKEIDAVITLPDVRWAAVEV